MDAVRMAADDDSRLEGWLVPFDGHIAGGKDSYSTRFSAQTEFALDWFPAGRPLLYQHGLDSETGIAPVGRIDALEVRDAGVWMQAQLDKQNEYFDAIRKMVKDGKLFLSSGSVEHLVQVNARSGDMIRWPIVEGSLTPTPANLYATVAARSAVEHMSAAGLPIGDIPFALVLPDDAAKEPSVQTASATKSAAWSATEDVPTGYGVNANAYRHPTVFDDLVLNGDGAKRDAEMESGDDVGSDERSFEDICSDLDRLLNPMYSGAYTQRLDTFPTHVLVKRYDYGNTLYAGPDEDDGCTYWDIPYTIGADLEPVLGTPVQVQHNESFTPVARTADIPFGFDAQLVQRHAATFARTTEEYGERRFREGRVMSGANMQTLSDTIDGMQKHVDTLRDLHKKASAKQEEAARAAIFADPELRRGFVEMLDLRPV